MYNNPEPEKDKPKRNSLKPNTGGDIHVYEVNSF